MFNAEKLLGKVVQEVVGSKSSMKKKKKKKGKKSKSNPIVSSLATGAGLMTAIGLGIGAYEILKDKSPTGSSPHTAPPRTPPPIPPAGHGQSTGLATAPPPPPTSQAQEPGRPVTPPSGDSEELATRMIRVMVAAAHADGNMDESEEEAVIARLRDEDFSQEEKMFLLGEMHNPLTIDELTAGVDDPATARMMYMLAVTVIEIDTVEERQWLDQLAQRLGLSKPVQAFIEEQA